MSEKLTYDVNPARAGMIPVQLWRMLRPGSKPRACGDDPGIPGLDGADMAVNPARAGMIPPSSREAW